MKSPTQSADIEQTSNGSEDGAHDGMRPPWLLRITSWLLGQLEKLRSRLRAESWLALSLLFVAVGIWLRSRRFFVSPISFWNDEANWAIQLLTKPIMAPSIRPVGFVAVSRFLAHTFGPTEVVLRFLPWLAGIGCSMVAIPLARRLFRAPAARLLFVAVIAFHPMAIDLSKEFKPYTISLLVHLCCVWLAAAYWDSGKRRFLAAAIGISLVGVLFGQDVVFAYPALYLVLGFAALRARRYRHLLLIALGMVLTLLLLGALYWFFWKYVSDHSAAGRKRVNGLSSIWWSQAYDLFYSGKVAGESHLGWLWRKLGELASFAGMRHGSWAPLGPLSGERLHTLAEMDALLWTVLSTLGLLCLAVQRRGRDLLLLSLPPLVTLAFNWLKLWPLGAFRSDLFLLAYNAAVAAVVLDRKPTTAVSEGRSRLWRQALPVTALVLLPLVAFERNWHHNKGAGGEFIEGVSALIELQGRDYAGAAEPLILDGYLCVVWRYYQHYHPGHRVLFADLNRRFRKQCVRPWTQSVLTAAKKTLRGSHDRFWVLLARQQEMQSFSRRSPRGFKVLSMRDVEDGQTMAIALRRR